MHLSLSAGFFSDHFPAPPTEALEMVASLKLSTCSDLNRFVPQEFVGQRSRSQASSGGGRLFKKQGLRLGRCLPYKHEGLSSEPPLLTQGSQAWKHTSLIPALGRQRQKGAPKAHCPVNLD